MRPRAAQPRPLSSVSSISYRYDACIHTHTRTCTYTHMHTRLALRAELWTDLCEVACATRTVARTGLCICVGMLSAGGCAIVCVLSCSMARASRACAGLAHAPVRECTFGHGAQTNGCGHRAQGSHDQVRPHTGMPSQVMCFVGIGQRSAHGSCQRTPCTCYLSQRTPCTCHLSRT